MDALVAVQGIAASVAALLFLLSPFWIFVSVVGYTGTGAVFFHGGGGAGGAGGASGGGGGGGGGGGENGTVVNTTTAAAATTATTAAATTAGGGGGEGVSPEWLVELTSVCYVLHNIACIATSYVLVHQVRKHETPRETPHETTRS
jgi:hypothetical protein